MSGCRMWAPRSVGRVPTRLPKGSLMLTRASVAAALLLMAAAVPAFAAGGPSPSNPEAVSIQPKDLPKDYTLIQHMFMGSRDLAPVERIRATTYQKHGFISAYLNQFARRGATGVGFLSSEAFAYSTPAGAQWDLTRAIKRDAKTLNTVRAPKVGDRSHGFTMVRNGHVTYQIDFQRGTFDMQLTVIGRTGQLSMADAARWAQVMAGRAR